MKGFDGMATQYDVIVLGGGIVGAASAYHLAQSGLKTLLVDQFEPGHKRGSSHGDGRVVRFNYTEAIYVEMARLAYTAWDALSTAAGRPLWQKTGLVEYGPQGHEAIAQSEQVLRRFDLPYERLTSQVANGRFPQVQFAPDTDIIYQGDGAVAFATPAVQALWRLASAAGADTLTGTRVTDIDLDNEMLRLQTAEGVLLQASRLVVTVGAWAGNMLQQLGLDIPLEVTQELLSYFAPTNDVDHRVGHMPVLIDYHTEAPFYSVPQIDVPGVKVGWHHTGTVVDPDNPQAATEHLLAGTQGWVERVFPHLSTAAIHTETCLYTNTPDYHFIMDHHPQHQNIVVGAGFSGHGFKFGPLLGEILSCLVQEKAAPVTLDTFSLARFDTPEQLQKRIGA